MNLSPARVAVLVALVVAGVAVMLNGFDDGESAIAAGTDVASPTGSDVVEPTESTSPSVSQSPEPELEPQVEGVSIQVLNGTEATGLAAEADAFLIGKGYDQGLTPGDLATKPVAGTTVYFRTGPDAEQSRVDAENLAARYLKGVDAKVAPLNDALDAEVAPKTQLVVVLGDDYAAAHPVA